MQFGQLYSKARRFGSIAAPKISRFGHVATNTLARAGEIGRMVASTGGKLVDALDHSPLGANPTAAAAFGGARSALRAVDMASNMASRGAAQGSRALSAYDKTVLPAAQKYLSSNFEKPRR